MRYGMNPHQTAEVVAGDGPRILHGEPSMINYLDALHAFQLVREADRATGGPAAASFKHVSPAGAALAGQIDPIAAVGIGAGQQNRVDCVLLAGAKARIWWLRRHRIVDELPTVAGMSRQDRLNWQIRFAGQEMALGQLREFRELFGMDAAAQYDDPAWRHDWTSTLSRITMVSDGYLPFLDNVEHAAELGVSTIVEPGGSARTSEVAASAVALGIGHIETGLRLFHH